MKANETNLQEIIEGSKQYIIPMFQRTYSWDTKQWLTLWEDLTELVDEDQQYENHFIGSIVSIPINVSPTGLQQFVVIDGQQRLTSLLILLSVIRDKAEEDGLSNLAAEINATMLVNSFKSGEEYFKLLPTQVDKDIFKRIIKNEVTDIDQSSGLVKCYNYFKNKLNDLTIDVEQLKNGVLHNLSLVSIVLSPDDNPYLVFESLNAKGQPLTEADLIRNYLFMRIEPSEQEEMYQGYWLPMQTNLGNSLTEFIRHFLMGVNLHVKQKDVYVKVKQQAEKANVIEYLKELAVFATYYDKLLHPEKEANEKIRYYLKRIQQFEARTAFPFLLYIYRDYDTKKYSLEQFIEILAIIDNFIVRRYVCNIESKPLNKMFGSLYNQLKPFSEADSIHELKAFLQVRGYPKDTEVLHELKNSPLYGSGDKREKCKFILSVLEETYGHKEKVGLLDATLEHIMPQTLTESWENELGGNFEDVHEKYLHVIGNLTLTGYNSELSNESFTTKKKYYAKSNFELNKDLVKYTTWDEQAINNRAEKLYEKFLVAWPYLGLASVKDNDVTGSSPRLLFIGDETIKVKVWREVLEHTLMFIYKHRLDYYKELLKTRSLLILIEKTAEMRSPKQLPNSHYIEANFSEKSIYTTCKKLFVDAGFDAESWGVEVEIK
ncbi:DUF262 domain-containing protein [Caryophanon latum]|uniref:DUF262 domain-containing protein n=1 Tax=Caryophanon latum TaxID=33977 RepID=A0A1C0YX24_9BACL|nr:DUF262 domain-containing protein [Caryophanon latum]OCS91711.1 hypothetical protein A6K76_08245 [Caryophanon latum]